MKKNYFLIFILLFLTACFDDNPLIGKWKIKSGQKNAQFNPCRTTEFTKNMNSCGSLAEKITYDIDGKQITVHGASGISAIYHMIDNNNFVINIPFMGNVYYQRIGNNTKQKSTLSQKSQTINKTESNSTIAKVKRRTKETAWNAFYKEPEDCLIYESDDHMVKCTNKRIRAKRKFNKLWSQNKIR